MNIDSEKLAKDYSSFVMEGVQEGPYPNNRVHNIGHSCLRNLYYFRTIKGKPKNAYSMEILEEAKAQEKMVIAKLTSMNYSIHEAQRIIEIPEYNIKGKIEGVLVDLNGNKSFFEIKTSREEIYDKINSIDDFINSDYFWFQNYLAQVTVYMAATGYDKVLFILKNRERSSIKLFWFNFDPDRYDKIIQKVQIINKAVDDKIPPDRMNYDPDICSKCDFYEECKPIDFVFEGMLDNHITSDTQPELVEEMDRRNYLKDKLSEYEILKKEYDKITKKHKELFRGKTVLIGDDYAITGKWIDVGSYQVEARKDYRMTIQNLNTGLKI